ncbi:MAG: T9SS type A sorting domain-containing protein [Bacteroidota bacterium]
MKQKLTLLTLFLVVLFYQYSFSQITFRGCTSNIMGAQDFSLTNTGTVTDGSITRNTFEATPNDFTQSCTAGVCELRIIWSTANSRWEIQLDTDGPLVTPDYTTAVLYHNNSASYPNPPNLSLGTWVDGLGGLCPSGEFVTFSGDVQGVLPVRFMDFNGEIIKNHIELSWQTSQEINNDYFSIERKGESGNFESIGQLTGAGRSNEVQSYSFLDTSPLRGVSYYRLKQVDIDGKFEYSQTIELNSVLQEAEISQIYPNPSQSSQFYIDYLSPERGKVEIFVYDMLGKLLSKKVKYVAIGENLLAVDIESLGKGLIHVQIKSGKTSLIRKLLIQ